MSSNQSDRGETQDFESPTVEVENEIPDLGPDTTIHNLPLEMLAAIFDHVDCKSRQGLRAVNRTWNCLISELYETHLLLDAQKFSYLFKCKAKHITVQLKNIVTHILTESALGIGPSSTPLSERLYKLTFSGEVCYDNVHKVLSSCHSLDTLIIDRIKFHKKRGTVVADKVRQATYFNEELSSLSNGPISNWLPALNHLVFTAICKEQDEVRLLHYLAKILKNKKLKSVHFFIMNDLTFHMGALECLFVSPSSGPVSSVRPTNQIFSANIAEHTAKLKYDDAITEIISTNFTSLAEFSVKLDGILQVRYLNVEFVQKKKATDWISTNQSVRVIKKFKFRDCSMHHSAATAPWLYTFANQTKMTKLIMDVYFNEYDQPNQQSSFLLTQNIIVANAPSLTRIYIDCDFPEFRNIGPVWNGKIFETCTSLSDLTLYHWQYHNGNWLGNFTELDRCPRLTGFKFLPSSLKIFNTTLTLVIPTEEFSDFKFDNCQQLEELELNCMPWFLTPAGFFKRIGINRFRHILNSMPKLCRIEGLVKIEYFNHEADMHNQVAAVSPTFFNKYGRNIDVNWYQSWLTMEIQPQTNQIDIDEEDETEYSEEEEDAPVIQ